MIILSRIENNGVVVVLYRADLTHGATISGPISVIEKSPHLMSFMASNMCEWFDGYAVYTVAGVSLVEATEEYNALVQDLSRAFVQGV